MFRKLRIELDEKFSKYEDWTEQLQKKIVENNGEIRLILDEILKKESIYSEKQEKIEEYLHTLPKDLSSFPKSLLYFFSERGLLLKEYTFCNAADGISLRKYKLAKQIWEHYDLLSGLCKKYCKKEDEFSYSLSDLSHEEKNIIRTFCENLKKQNALGYCIDQEDILHITRLEKKQWIPFLNGGWGELSLLYILRKALLGIKEKTNLDTSHLKYHFFKNLKFAYPEHQDIISMELDVVLLINKTVLFIFESKTGNVLVIDKWVDRTRLFETDPPLFSLDSSKNGNILPVRGYFITCSPNNLIPSSYFRPFHLMHFSILEEEFLSLLKTIEKRDQ